MEQILMNNETFGSQIPMVVKTKVQDETSLPVLPVVRREKNLKIVMLGLTAVGKSSILHRYISGVYNPHGTMTIGVEFYSTHFNVNGEVVPCNLWDTSGEERFRSLTGSYYRDCDGCILVYDVTYDNEESFEKLDGYYQDVLKYSSTPVAIMIGNKTDLLNENTPRFANSERAIAYRKRYNMDHFETSAKTGTGIKGAFQLFVETIVAKRRTPQVQIAQTETFPKESKEACICKIL